MKKHFKKLVAALLAVTSLLAVGCDWNSKDVNNVVDKVFSNYEEMNSTETSAYKNFKNINIASSYLGYGYDVINDPYMKSSAINLSAPILDMNKIENAQLKMVKENRSNSVSYEGSTMEELYQSYAASLNVYGKAGKMFSGGLKVDYSGSTSEKTYWYFYKKVCQVMTFSVYLVDSLGKLQDMLADDFKKDLMTMEVGALYEKYGTHLIKEAAMGGRIEINTIYSSESSTATNSVQAAVNAHIKYMSKASVNVEASASYENALEKENVKQNTKIEQIGGIFVNLESIDDFSANYSKWFESFDNSLEYAALSGIVGENSLLGLWELLPAGNEKRAEELKNKFIELSGESYEKLCNQFKLKSGSSSGTEQSDMSWEALTYGLERKNSADGNKYDASKPTTDKVELGIHDGFEIGEIVLYGCAEQVNKLKLRNRQDFSIKYKINLDITSLPQSCDGVKGAWIESDTAESVNGTNIKKQVGKGAYWIRITYTDDSQEEFNSVNFMNGKVKGSFIELLSSDQLNKDKALKKIELVVVYEIKFGAPGFLGIWWNGYSNWRCERVFDFSIA